MMIALENWNDVWNRFDKRVKAKLASEIVAAEQVCGRVGLCLAWRLSCQRNSL